MCVLGTQKSRLIETVLLSTHNICFGWEIRKKVFCYTLLSGYWTNYMKALASLALCYLKLFVMFVISKDTDQSSYIAIITPCLHCIIITHNAQNSTPIHQILTSLYSWASWFETCLKMAFLMMLVTIIALLEHATVLFKHTSRKGTVTWPIDKNNNDEDFNLQYGLIDNQNC